MFLIFEKSNTGVRNAPKSKKITKSLKKFQKTQKCVVSGQIPLITTIILCVKKLQKIKNTISFKAILLYKQSHNNHHFYAIAFSNCIRSDIFASQTENSGKLVVRSRELNTYLARRGGLFSCHLM